MMADQSPAPVPQVATVEAEEELPQIDESTVESFSTEVRHQTSVKRMLTRSRSEIILLGS